MEQIEIKSFNLPEMEAWVEDLGERRFRARQIYRNLYVRRVRSWGECTDLSGSLRQKLELTAPIDALGLVKTSVATDGTTKYLFRLHDGSAVEAVLIPDHDRNTLCISSQVGCALGCRFCLTGSYGFKRNLTTAEIVDQVCRVQRELGSDSRITNLVFMGMGEPLLNFDPLMASLSIICDPSGLDFSHRRVTVSTAGIVPNMPRLGAQSRVNLAVSLHATDNALRDDLMPVNRKYPLEKLMDACRSYPLPNRKRITFEYILLEGVNDAPSQARKLVRLLHGIPCKINLIPFNPHPGSEFQKPPWNRVLSFQEVLLNSRFTAIIRQSRGDDIAAACGQLAARTLGAVV